MIEDNTYNYPLVSVIIPTYKRPDNLIRAIESVQSQTYPNIEIIVVDDNGKGTEYQIETEKELSSLIEKNKIMYIAHDVNKNGSAARNTGFRASHGEYINFLDDDDVLLPKKIETQVQKLEGTSEEWGGCYCNSINLIKNQRTGKIIVQQTTNSLEGNICKEYLLAQCSFNTSTLLFKKAAVAQLNGFDESFARHQDVEFMVRFFDSYKILCAGDDPLTKYDMTSGGRPPYDDYSTKVHFLESRKDCLVRQGILNEVSWWFWIQCARNEITLNNYKLYFKAIKNARSFKGIALSEYLLHIKLLIKQPIIKILNLFK